MYFYEIFLSAIIILACNEVARILVFEYKNDAPSTQLLKCLGSFAVSIIPFVFVSYMFNPILVEWVVILLLFILLIYGVRKIVSLFISLTHRAGNKSNRIIIEEFQKEGGLSDLEKILDESTYVKVKSQVMGRCERLENLVEDTLDAITNYVIIPEIEEMCKSKKVVEIKGVLVCFKDYLERQVSLSPTAALILKGSLAVSIPAVDRLLKDNNIENTIKLVLDLMHTVPGGPAEYLHQYRPNLYVALDKIDKNAKLFKVKKVEEV